MQGLDARSIHPLDKSRYLSFETKKDLLTKSTGLLYKSEDLLIIG